MKTGVQVWYKPRTKWVLCFENLSYDVALGLVDTLRKKGAPAYVVFICKVR